MMLIIKTISQAFEFCQTEKGSTIGLVPTMGCLHEGHISLMQEARQSCDKVVVSIFVNPLQFGPNEDFNRYPRHFEKDADLCKAAGVDAIFYPSTEEMYATGYPPKVRIKPVDLDNHLCGAKRPGHFDGVCTVVSKLLHIFSPQKAFFGEKDIQQLRIIQTMVTDLNFPVQIISCKTVRAADGLALSSRNSYLSIQEREQALIIPQLLHYLIERIEQGEYQVDRLIFAGKTYLNTLSAHLDYLEIVDYTYLQPIHIVQGKVIIAVALFIGKTRLIDNVIYKRDPLC